MVAQPFLAVRGDAEIARVSDGDRNVFGGLGTFWFVALGKSAQPGMAVPQNCRSWEGGGVGQISCELDNESVYCAE